MSESLKDKILNRMQSLDVASKRSLGQNFLVDQKIVDTISKEVLLRTDHKWIEIGPGLGSLTDCFDKNNLVRLIELDRVFANYWTRDRGFKVVEKDALDIDWKLFIEELQQEFENFKLGLVSNLPYQISARIVIEMSMVQKLESMVLMFQKEVADRILSPSKNSDYGFLSVIAQSFWSVKKLIFVSPNCFHPKPRVDSQVLVFSSKNSEVLNSSDYVEFVKKCFSEKRKKIFNKAKKMNLLKEFESFFTQENLSFDLRAEELTPEQYQKLFNFCYNRKS